MLRHPPALLMLGPTFVSRHSDTTAVPIGREFHSLNPTGRQAYFGRWWTCRCPLCRKMRCDIDPDISCPSSVPSMGYPRQAGRQLSRLATKASKFVPIWLIESKKNLLLVVSA